MGEISEMQWEKAIPQRVCGKDNTKATTTLINTFNCAVISTVVCKGEQITVIVYAIDVWGILGIGVIADVAEVFGGVNSTQIPTLGVGIGV